MPSHPLLIAVSVIAATLIAGIITAIVREIRLFSDYRDIAPQVKTIANHLRAEVFRDRQDLVVSGHHKNIPTVLRFSKETNTPAMGLYVRIPSPCQLSLMPKRMAGRSRSQNIKIGSRILEENFTAKSTTATELNEWLRVDRNIKLLEALCCTRKTIFELNPGRLELLEMALPEELTRHVFEHLAIIRELSESFESMPGSKNVEVRPLEQGHRSWFFKAAIAAGVIVVAISVIAATRERARTPVLAASDPELFHGIPATDASFINGIGAWRAATRDELNPQFANWLQDSGKKPDSRIAFNPAGDNSSRGVAYLLVRDDGARRLVVLIDQRTVFDTCFSRLDGIAMVPVSSFPKLKWGQWQAPTQKPTGDALLVVRDATDPRSAELLFFPNGTLFSGIPKDYSAIDLQSAN
jgi:hypothetical protein